MKKALTILIVVALLIGAGAWYFLSNANELIRGQIEQQGSKYLGTAVSVESVDLVISQGRMTIGGLQVSNPQGFSENQALSVAQITLDLGNLINQPYQVQLINIQAPKVLYEMNASGQGNLVALKDNLLANLPQSDKTPPTQDGANPLVIVEDVTIKSVQLTLDFAQLPTDELKIKKKVYQLTLPTFNTGPVGQPDGIPADQVGAVIVKAMLDQAIDKAKVEAKNRLAEEAKKKAKELLDKEKDKLLDKAKDKLKNLFN